MSFVAETPSAYLSVKGTREEDDFILAVYSNVQNELVLIDCAVWGYRDDALVPSVCLSDLQPGTEYTVLVGTFYDTPRKAIFSIVPNCPGWRISPCYLPDGSCAPLEGPTCSAREGRWAEGESACRVLQCTQPVANDAYSNATPIVAGDPALIIDTSCAADDPQLAWIGFDRIIRRGVWFRTLGTGGTLSFTATHPDIAFSAGLLGLCDAAPGFDFLTAGLNFEVNGTGEGAAIEWCSQLGKTYLIIVGAMWCGSHGGLAEVRLDDLGPCNSPLRCCRADTNRTGATEIQDLFDFLTFYHAQDLRADFDRSGSVTPQDLFDFLDAFFSGCS